MFLYMVFRFGLYSVEVKYRTCTLCSQQFLVYKIVTMAGPKERLSAAEWRGGDPVPVGEVWYLLNA